MINEQNSTGSQSIHKSISKKYLADLILGLGIRSKKLFKLVIGNCFSKCFHSSQDILL